jgi:hypothetical protein
MVFRRHCSSVSPRLRVIGVISVVKADQKEFCFDCKGVLNPQDRFGVGLIEKLVVKFGISCVGIFPLAEAIHVLRSKTYSSKSIYPILHAWRRGHMSKRWRHRWGKAAWTSDRPIIASKQSERSVVCICESAIPAKSDPLKSHG